MLLYARWTQSNGVGLGLGLVASIYVHEVGHVAALRRYGTAASAPMFVPGLGAFVRAKQYPTDAHEDARTGLAGPLWGLFAVVVAAAIGKVWSLPTATAVASWAATINLFNLIVTRRDYQIRLGLAGASLGCGQGAHDDRELSSLPRKRTSVPTRRPHLAPTPCLSDSPSACAILHSIARRDLPPYLAAHSPK